MHCYACRDATRANTILLIRELQIAAVLAELLLHYYYDNCNTLPCSLCYYYTTTSTTTRCRACRVTTTLLLRQLQRTAVPAVLLLYYYDNYNALPCLP